MASVFNQALQLITLQEIKDSTDKVNDLSDDEIVKLWVEAEMIILSYIWYTPQTDYTLKIAIVYYIEASINGDLWPRVKSESSDGRSWTYEKWLNWYWYSLPDNVLTLISWYKNNFYTTLL